MKNTGVRCHFSLPDSGANAKESKTGENIGKHVYTYIYIYSIYIYILYIYSILYSLSLQAILRYLIMATATPDLAAGCSLKNMLVIEDRHPNNQGIFETSKHFIF